MTINSVYRAYIEETAACPPDEIDAATEKVLDMISESCEPIARSAEEAINMILSAQEEKAFKAGFRAAVRLALDAVRT